MLSGGAQASLTNVLCFHWPEGSCLDFFFFFFRAATALPAKWRLQGDCIHYWGIQFKCHPFPLGTVFSPLMFALGMVGWEGGGGERRGEGHQFLCLVVSALRLFFIFFFLQQTLAPTDSRWHRCKSRHFTLHSDTWTLARFALSPPPPPCMVSILLSTGPLKQGWL